MVTTVEISSSEKPHISSNELGKYVFSSSAARARILRDQKFKNEGRASYYSPSEHSIWRSFKNGVFDETLLRAEREKIHPKDPTNERHQHKSRNNREMLQRFLELREEATPSKGKHMRPRSASLDLNGVTISVRPEIITESPETGLFSFTKFYFSQNKVSADAAEIILLILIKYGQTYPRPGLRFDLENTKLIDCHGRTIIHGHTIGRHREQQLRDAVEDINRLWPLIQRNPKDPFLYEGPGG
jgi:hypothetical protein